MLRHARMLMRRHRRIVIASALTLITSLVLLGLTTFTRWQGHQALQGDTSTVLAQTGEQLLRTLQSRRGTLTFLRDTLNRRADLTSPQLQAMGESAVDHTRRLIAIGLLKPDEPVEWWAGPLHLSVTNLSQLNRAIQQRTHLRGVWRVPSTFAVPLESQRFFLVMLEPLRATAHGPSAIVGLFELKSLLEDFFASSLPQRYPAQVFEEHTLVYQSPDWQLTRRDVQPMVAERPVVIDATRWTIQMQPSQTRVVKTLSWLNLLLVGVSIIAGVGVIAIVWILAARAWILQRAVNRRTAALRRVTTRLRQLATTDELTGLHNRRFFLNRWVWECDRAKRYRRPLACLMIDVNGFKQVNDRLGHHVGDLVLQRVAQELKTMLRQSDILARFGGDEFVIALPETTEAQAASVAEKLQRLTIALPPAQTKDIAAVSLSVGMGTISRPTDTAQSLLETADQSLYAAKRARPHSSSQSSADSHASSVPAR